MHEVSIAANIIEIVNKELKKHHGECVESIHLQIGKLSGVVVESLRFALEVSQKDGILKNADITMEEMPAKAVCRACRHEFEAEDYFQVCPECGSFEIDLLSGREMYIKSIRISKTH